MDTLSSVEAASFTGLLVDPVRTMMRPDPKARARDRIAHMHLHDMNDRGPHQALFPDTVDIEAHLRAAREHQWTVVLESKTVRSLTASVEALKARGWM